MAATGNSFFLIGRFLKILYSETACANGPKRFIWPNSFREDEFKKSANQKQESPVAAMFVNRSGRNEQPL
jgi:hypothetical protein